MAAPATEASVRDWRYGNTQAKRLCAAMLYLESFQDVDPQHPLGGPDGLKGRAALQEWKDLNCRCIFSTYASDI
jgi:hypothetical protein